MPATEVMSLVEVLGAEGLEVCVGGGWGVDALLGEQTREHSDLDLWLPAPSLEGLFRTLAARGLDRIHPWPGDRPWNFVLHDGRSRRVDLHIYEILHDGSLHYGSVLDPFMLPAAALSHNGMINGVAVRCEQPAWALQFHTGYPPRASDRHDVLQLCQRFAFDLPDEYR
jgi:lincosamide nucleotidyltransferase A/C/D/E